MRLKLVLIIKAVILQFLIQWETSYRQAPMLVPSLAFPRGCCHTWNKHHFHAKIFLWNISGPQVIASAASDGSYEPPEGQSPLLPLSLGFCQHPLCQRNTADAPPHGLTDVPAFEFYVFWETDSLQDKPSLHAPNCHAGSWKGILKLLIVFCEDLSPLRSVFSLFSLAARARPDKEGLISISIISIPPHHHTWAGTERGVSPPTQQRAMNTLMRQQLLILCKKCLLIWYQLRLKLLGLLCILFSTKRYIFENVCFLCSHSFILLALSRSHWFSLLLPICPVHNHHLCVSFDFCHSWIFASLSSLLSLYLIFLNFPFLPGCEMYKIWCQVRHLTQGK